MSQYKGVALSTTTFSALLPSVLRLIGTDGGQGVHLAASVNTPLADWGGAVRTENDAACALEVLEPFLLLLSIAGYGVPEVVFAGVGVAQADVVSVRQPALEIRRGTEQVWPPTPYAPLGLRVCPTVATPIDLGAELATYKPGFDTKTCGWLMLPVSEADLVTSIDDLVNTKLWLPLARKIAAGSASVGVATLIDAARGYLPANPLPAWAALPDVAASALLALQSLGAAGVLEAEYLADRAGMKLSEQMADMQERFDGAVGWLAQVDCRGSLGAMAEALSGWWPDDVVAEDAQDTPSLGGLESLGLIRALIASIGSTDVRDTGAGAPEPNATERPVLTRLPAIRRGKPAEMTDDEWRKFVDPEALAQCYVKVEFDVAQRAFKPKLGVTLDTAKFTRSATWDVATKAYKLLDSPLVDLRLCRPIDFARTRFELEANDKNATSYLEPTAGGAKAAKPKFRDGFEDQKVFWCSALTMWTLAASGYDLNLALLGAPDDKTGEREPHGYIDTNTWCAITAAMLIDGQAEACLALGVIMLHAGNDDPAKIPGRTVVFTGTKGLKFRADGAPQLDKETGKQITGWNFTSKATIRDLTGLDKPVQTSPPQGTSPKQPSRAVIEAKPAVPDGIDVDVGITATKDLNPYVFEVFFKGTYGAATEAGTDYDDHLAVRYGVGAVKLFGWGDTVPCAQIRPGDIGQYQERYKGQTQYIGKGHAFQVWAVKVQVDGEVVELDPDTDPSTVPRDAPAIHYRCIDANVSGAKQHPCLVANSGVSISDWIPVSNPDNLSLGRRYYFARLHESAWSDANVASDTGMPS